MNRSSSRPHRCDEFPAEYSLASCSPAELASASSATLMLQPSTLVRRANLSERQPGNSLTVSLQGVTAVSVQLLSLHSSTGTSERSRIRSR
jgi:hypothetical protein